MNSLKGFQVGRRGASHCSGGWEWNSPHSRPLGKLVWEPPWGCLFPAPHLGLSPRCVPNLILMGLVMSSS